MSEQKLKTLESLIEESELKLEALGKKFGYNDRTGWYKKRKNVESWTLKDIQILAKALHKTPAQIFEVLYTEAIKEPVNTL